MYTGLEIHFDEVDYSTDEGDITGLSGISLGLRETQSPFRMELIPANISVAESAEYNLTNFLSPVEIDAEQHAEPGEMCVDVFHMFAFKGVYRVILRCAGSNTIDLQLQHVINTVSYLEIDTNPTSLTPP